MGSFEPVTEDEVDLWEDRFSKGETCRGIAEDIGRAVDTVSTYLKERGYQIPRKPTEIEIDNWEKRFVEKEESIRSIARDSRWSRPTIRRRLNQRGIDTNPGFLKAFWQKVDVGEEDECWEWQASTNEHGYGRFCIRTKTGYMRNAHRISYILDTKENITRDQHVLHKCHNPPCVNPNHLKLGDAKENMTDIVMEGKHHYASLNPQEVKELRQRYDNGEGIDALVKDYPVTESGIKKAIAGTTWKRVDGPTGL